MRAYLSRRYRFSASHRLHSPSFSDAENWITYGKCNNPYGHGHNYIVEVTVGGQVDEQTGMVCDMVQMDDAIYNEVLARYDTANLNADEDFREMVPTTENLCMVIHRQLGSVFKLKRLGEVDLVRVRVEETSNNSFEYAGE